MQPRYTKRDIREIWRHCQTRGAYLSFRTRAGQWEGWVHSIKSDAVVTRDTCRVRIKPVWLGTGYYVEFEALRGLRIVPLRDIQKAGVGSKLRPLMESF